MAGAFSMSTLLSIALAVRWAVAQSQGPTPFLTASPTTSPTSTYTEVDVVTATPSTTDIPLSLWNVANSLITQYYPSTSLSGLGSLSWPETVTIGSATYTVMPPARTNATSSTSRASSSPSSLSSASFSASALLASSASASTSILNHQPGQSAAASSNNSQQPLRTDEKLGIGIGVALAVVALIVLALVLCCLHKRKKTSGSYFKRRPTPSISDSEIGSWRGTPAVVAGPGPLQDWQKQHNSRVRSPLPPPMAMHPAHQGFDSSRSTSEENPFFTPQERSEAQLGHYEPETGALRDHDIDVADMEYRRSSSSMRNSRPPTPFSPVLMMGGSQPAHRAMDQENPFASPEDDEVNDVVSPIVPAKSPERRHSPMVHYPSVSEVSEFDFTGEGRGRTLHNSSSEDGGDGWQPRRESVVGRYELA